MTFVSFLVLMNCSDNITDPEPEPGRRDYVWTVDTIKSYDDTIYRSWGSSPSDIWAVTGGGNLYKSFYHFDGNAWTTDGEFRFVSPHSIWGFSKDNIYIGGQRGEIWHYDGTNWQEITKLTKDGRSDLVFDNMWGRSVKDLYATGAFADDRGYYNNSVIAHYNGSWTMLNTNGLNGIVERLFRNKEDNTIYMRTNRLGGGEFPDSNLIYSYSGGKYKKLYANLWTKGLQADISLIDYDVYFVLGNKISKRANNQFETFLEIDDPDFYQRIWGRNSKDIFLFMTDGIAHYNGDDIAYLFYFNHPKTYVISISFFDKEIFIIVVETQTNVSLCYHGILQD